LLTQQLIKGQLGLRPGVFLEEMVLPRPPDDLVVDVRDVHHIVNVVAEVVGQNPPQNVKRNVRSVEGAGESKDKILMLMWLPPDNQPGMPHVGGIVDGGSAAIPRYIISVQRHELLLLTGEAVE